MNPDFTIGNSSICFANCSKVGSTYFAGWIDYPGIWDKVVLSKLKSINYIVVPIREPLKRWWSGYCHDMKWFITNPESYPISKTINGYNITERVVRGLMDNLSEYKSRSLDDERNLINILENFNENTSLESYPKEISFLNEVVEKLHRHRYPNEILNFNTQLKKHWGDLSLSECWKISNVVFIELKDISNPKFHQWIIDVCEKDGVEWGKNLEEMNIVAKGNYNTNITKKYFNWFWSKDRIEIEDFKFYHYIHTDNKNNLMDKLLIKEYDNILQENKKIYKEIKKSKRILTF